MADIPRPKDNDHPNVFCPTRPSTQIRDRVLWSLGRWRLRRAEIGQHHHISGRYLHQYANEAAWREDNRRKPNGILDLVLAGAAFSYFISRNGRDFGSSTLPTVIDVAWNHMT